jgi:outer membrane protein OmpA-like peptidoglycan-associated protein
LIFGGHGIAVRWRGKLTRLGTENFPLLVNGSRITVPALHARGDFSGRGQSWSPDIWILQDPNHALILKVTDATSVFQTVKINFIDVPSMEATLKGKCRVEVPGIYFGFNSAAIDPASDKTLDGLANIFAKHPDWNITIEGHTDNVGTDAANQKLSERRAESVRSRLTTRYHVAASHIIAAGFGARVPRETNATIEGRAHNRRVELVRPCGGSH